MKTFLKESLWPVRTDRTSKGERAWELNSRMRKRLFREPDVNKGRVLIHLFVSE